MIKTERLILRHPQYAQSAVKKQVEWLNDVDVVKYSQQRHQSHTIASQVVYIARFKTPDVFMEIYRDDTIIGTITADVDENNGVADIGIMIGDKSSWGKGFGKEAWSGFCNAVVCRKIEAGCDQRNIPMMKIFESYEMQLEGKRTMHFVNGNGSYSDMLMYGKVLR